MRSLYTKFSVAGMVNTEQGLMSPNWYDDTSV